MNQHSLFKTMNDSLNALQTKKIVTYQPTLFLKVHEITEKKEQILYLLYLPNLKISWNRKQFFSSRPKLLTL